MKRGLSVLVCGMVWLLGSWLVQAEQQTQSPEVPRITVKFSPRGGATTAVVKTVKNARSTILVQAYSFTSTPIAEALVEAHRRGIKVRVILDESQESERYTEADVLAEAEVPILIDDRHAIAHDKVMIVDNRAVITGSFNFTKAAEEKNAENLLIITSADLAAVYTANWDKHWKHSRAYRRDAAQPTKTQAQDGWSATPQAAEKARGEPRR